MTKTVSRLFLGTKKMCRIKALIFEILILCIVLACAAKKVNEVGIIEKGQENQKEKVALTAYEYRKKGGVFGKQGKHEEAIPWFSKAVEINPNYAEAYFDRGFSYHSLNRLQEALSDYSRAIKIDSSFSMPYANRGNIYTEFKKYDLALKDYDTAIHLSPKEYHPYANRGLLFRDLDRLPEACSDWKKACSLGYKPSCRKVRGDCYGIPFPKQ